MRIPPSSPASRALVVLAAVSGGACSSETTEVVALDAPMDHATVIVGEDAPGPAEAAPTAVVDAGGLTTSLRVALLAPIDIGVNICARANGNNAPYLNSGAPLLFLPSAGDAGVDAHVGDTGVRDTGAHDATARDGGAHDAGHHADDAHEGHEASAGADAKDDSAKDATVDARSGKDARAGDAARDGHDAVGPVDGRAHDAAPRSADGGVGPGGVPYGHVSPYITLPLAGTVEIAVVRGGATTCASPLLVARVTLDAGKRSTLVVETAAALPQATGHDGGGARDATSAVDATRDAGVDAAAVPALTIVALTDESTSVAGLARARFFNGSTSVDGAMGAHLRVAAVAQTATGALDVPLALDVPPRAVSVENPANPAVDPLGYWSGELPSSTTPVELRVGGTTDAGVDARTDGSGGPAWTFSSLDSLSLVPATTHTGFIVGGGAAATLVWCEDGVLVDGGAVVLPSCEQLRAQ